MRFALNAILPRRTFTHNVVVFVVRVHDASLPCTHNPVYGIGISCFFFLMKPSEWKVTHKRGSRKRVQISWPTVNTRNWSHALCQTFFDTEAFFLLFFYYIWKFDLIQLLFVLFFLLLHFGHHIHWMPLNYLCSVRVWRSGPIWLSYVPDHMGLGLWTVVLYGINFSFSNLSKYFELLFPHCDDKIEKLDVIRAHDTRPELDRYIFQSSLMLFMYQKSTIFNESSKYIYFQKH